MHTIRFETTDFGTITIHHNGDWSGTAIVQWSDPGTGILRQVELPAPVLLAGSRKSAVASLTAFVTSAIEQWDPCDEDKR